MDRAVLVIVTYQPGHYATHVMLLSSTQLGVPTLNFTND
jgi:hypothetical protein